MLHRSFLCRAWPQPASALQCLSWLCSAARKVRPVPDWPCASQTLAIALQSRVSEALHVDIHPAARIGRGVLIDHATGVVIGETAIVGDNVSMLHHVTLGGSGTGKGVRHPHIGAGLSLERGNGFDILGEPVGKHERWSN